MNERNLLKKGTEIDMNDFSTDISNKQTLLENKFVVERTLKQKQLIRNTYIVLSILLSVCSFAVIVASYILSERAAGLTSDDAPNLFSPLTVLGLLLLPTIWAVLGDIVLRSINRDNFFNKMHVISYFAGFIEFAFIGRLWHYNVALGVQMSGIMFFFFCDRIGIVSVFVILRLYAQGSDER